jgi:thiamine biosynthesis protein ThiI
METLFLLKIGELALKGGNRGFFESMLKKNLKRALERVPAKIVMRNSRVYLTVPSEAVERTERVLAATFGLTYFTKARSAEKELESIIEASIETVRELRAERPDALTFKVESRRTDKSFPLDSYGISREVGHAVLEAFPELSVDVHRPAFQLGVEVRERVYVYGPEQAGPGGLPVGTAGKGLLLLSGGIDSPVAGYLMAKRGVRLGAVYFHAYPYTSDEAKEKVVRLARIISAWTGPMRLFVVPFTEVQLAIKRQAPEDQTTLIMRACMMRIAHRIAERRGAISLTTGESLSQVASQTAESLRFTGSMTDLPIFRPLVGMDKEEIIRIARKIGTFETSILPYDDCCTIFSPRHPLVRPDFNAMRESWASLELEPLMNEAMRGTEELKIEPER